jgi:hypothetical protein
MCKDKQRSSDEGVNKMAEMILNVNNFSLSEFIKANRSKIDAITPVNPTIKQDDEWRDEDCWDELYRKKTEK